LDDGVNGKKGATAIRGAPLPSNAPFSHLAGVISEDFELMHPSSLLIGESEGFCSIVKQKISYGCEQESQDLI
jgi:hypothetical protein